jgi:pimeloyl-ACP methyl ester carboxylesterase
MVQERCQKPVDVIAHSMGGVVARAAISLFRAPVRRTVFIGTPHFGAANAYKILHPDHTLDPLQGLGWWERIVAHGLWRRVVPTAGGERTIGKQLRAISPYLDSLYELLPDDNYLSDGRAFLTFSSDRDGQGSPPPITSATYYVEAAPASPWSHELSMAAHRAMEFKRRLGRHLPVKSLVVYSRSLMTAGRIEWRESNEASEEAARAGVCVYRWRSQTVKEPGDGVVTAFSAVAGCDTCLEVEDTHLGLPNNPEVHEGIASFLN